MLLISLRLYTWLDEKILSDDSFYLLLQLLSGCYAIVHILSSLIICSRNFSFLFLDSFKDAFHHLLCIEPIQYLIFFQKPLDICWYFWWISRFMLILTEVALAVRTSWVSYKVHNALCIAHVQWTYPPCSDECCSSCASVCLFVLYVAVKTSFFCNTGQSFSPFFHLTCDMS